MTLEQAVAYAFQAGRPPLSDTQQRGAEFHIEIDEAKKQRQVTEVVTSTAFQALQEKARRFRSAQV